RGSAGGQMEKSSAEKFHSITWSARASSVMNSRRSDAHLLCRGLRTRFLRFCPGVEEHEPQAARLAVDLRLDGRAAGAVSPASRTLRSLQGVGQPRGMGVEKLVVEHRLERGEIAAAHRRVALILGGEDFLVAAHRQTSLAVSPRALSLRQLAWRL